MSTKAEQHERIEAITQKLGGLPLDDIVFHVAEIMNRANCITPQHKALRDLDALHLASIASYLADRLRVLRDRLRRIVEERETKFQIFSSQVDDYHEAYVRGDTQRAANAYVYAELHSQEWELVCHLQVVIYENLKRSLDIVSQLVGVSTLKQLDAILEKFSALRHHFEHIEAKLAKDPSGTFVSVEEGRISIGLPMDDDGSIVIFHGAKEILVPLTAAGDAMFDAAFIEVNEHLRRESIEALRLCLLKNPRFIPNLAEIEHQMRIRLPLRA